MPAHPDLVASGHEQYTVAARGTFYRASLSPVIFLKTQIISLG